MPESKVLSDNQYFIDLQSILNVNDNTECFKRIEAIAMQYNLDRLKVEHDFGIELERRIKEDVIRIKEYEKEIQKKLKKAHLINWLAKFLTSKRDAEEMIDGFLTSNDEVEIHNLESLSKLIENRKSRYYVEGLMRSGLFMVVGQPKTGKSLWTMDMGIKLVLGEPFLNRKTLRSNVLIVQNEEALASTGETLLTSCLQDYQLNNPLEYAELIKSKRLIVVKGLDIGVDLKEIMDIVDKNNINVLIVDSFRASIKKSNLTELDVGASQLLYSLQLQIHTRDMLGVVVHHSNKSDNNSGKTTAFNGIAGHNSLAGANDGVVKLMFNPDERDEGRETIDCYFYPRKDNPSTLNIVYEEGEACKWGFKVRKENTLTENVLAVMRDILTVLQERYELWQEDNDPSQQVYGLKTTQLCNALGINKTELNPIVNMMLKAGALEKRRENKVWVFHIPVGGSELYYLVEEHNKKAELLAAQEKMDKCFLEKLLECKTIDELDDLHADLDEEDKARIKSKRTEEHEAHIFKLRHPSKFQLGDRVYLKEFPNDGIATVLSIELDMKCAKFNESSWIYKLQFDDGNTLDRFTSYDLELAPKAEVVDHLEKTFELEVSTELSQPDDDSDDDDDEI